VSNRRQVLALGSLLKEPKTDNKEVQHFRGRVVADRQRLKALLNQRAQEAYAHHHMTSELYEHCERD
jgi:hypothetical protein